MPREFGSPAPRSVRTSGPNVDRSIQSTKSIYCILYTVGILVQYCSLLYYPLAHLKRGRLECRSKSSSSCARSRGSPPTGPPHLSEPNAAPPAARRQRTRRGRASRRTRRAERPRGIGSSAGHFTITHLTSMTD